SAKIVNQSGANALANLATNAAGGSFTLSGGRDFTTAGAFSTAGTVTLNSGSTLTVHGNYTQAGLSSQTILLGGYLNPTPGYKVDLQAGSLSGYGTVQSDLDNAGEVIVGGVNSTGILTVSGKFTQTATGVLTTEIGGLTAGAQYDQL